VISGYLIAENYKPDGRWLNQADADVALCQGAPWTKIIMKIHTARATERPGYGHSSSAGRRSAALIHTLATISTAYPTPPHLTLFDPPIERASSGPRS
jgi:hypothetical protein